MDGRAFFKKTIHSVNHRSLILSSSIQEVLGLFATLPVQVGSLVISPTAPWLEKAYVSEPWSAERGNL